MVLSLLIALGSVIGLVAPTVAGLLTEPVSNVVPGLAHVEPVRFDPGETDASGRHTPAYGIDLVLAVSNSGDLSGALGALTVSLHDDDRVIAEGTEAVAVPVGAVSTEVHVVSIPLAVRDSAAMPTQIVKVAGRYVSDDDESPLTSVPVDSVRAILTVYQAGGQAAEERVLVARPGSLAVVVE